MRRKRRWSTIRVRVCELKGHAEELADHFRKDRKPGDQVRVGARWVRAFGAEKVVYVAVHRRPFEPQDGESA